MRYMRGFIKVLVCLLAWSFFINTNVQAYSSTNKSYNEIEKIRNSILNEKDKYLTVGSENCEFNTIKKALEAIDSERNIIYMLDEVHSETSIIIEKEVIIRGFGTDHTTIEGATDATLAVDRIFLVEKEGKLVLENLTIQHGRVNEIPRTGAGILNRGNLKIEKCVIRDNIATYGVGIFSDGYLDIRDSIVSGNRSVPRPLEEERTGEGCAGSGGGIKVQNGEAEITNCSIIDNYAIMSGGGVKISCPAKVTLTNCTIAENKSENYGGGISSNGDTRLIHCTIIKNDSHKGGGVHVTSKVDLVANLIAENTRNDFVIMTDNPNFSPEVRENQYNFIGDGKFESYLSGEVKLKENPNKEGTYITYALEIQSSAIDAIPVNVSFTKTDQRGIDRQDGRNDIGAYEFNGNKYLMKYYMVVFIGVILLLIMLLIKKKINYGK